MALEKQFLFILGSSRSGTTWLQGMLGSHPSICVYAEVKLFSHYVGPWLNSWEKDNADKAPAGLPTLWSKDEFYGFLREFLDKAYERVLAIKPEASIILDKHPQYSGDVDYINTLIPNVKFIHCIRDGRDVAASLLAASQGWGSQWAPKDVESAARWWELGVRAANKARQYGSRYLEVRYEDLLTNGDNVLKSVFEFLGIQIDPSGIASILEQHRIEKMRQRKVAGKFEMPEGFFRKGRIGDWWTTLNPVQRYLFHQAAGDLLCELGYASNSWWIGHGYQRVTVPLRVLLSPGHARQREEVTTAIKTILGPRWTARARSMRAALKKTACS